MSTRADNRPADSLRPFTMDRDVPGAAAGKVLVRAGRTTVLCTASIENDVPPWLSWTRQGLGNRGIQYASRQHFTP